jgi:hypothetical protein
MRYRGDGSTTFRPFRVCGRLRGVWFGWGAWRDWAVNNWNTVVTFHCGPVSFYWDKP